MEDDTPGDAPASPPPPAGPTIAVVRYADAQHVILPALEAQALIDAGLGRPATAADAAIAGPARQES